MGTEAANARFKLIDARITKIKELEKVAFVGVACQSGKYPSFYDVKVFSGAMLAGFQQGDAVTISGELQMQKPREQGGKWELQLVARKMERGDDAKAPRPREQRQAPPPSEPNYGDDDVAF